LLPIFPPNGLCCLRPFCMSEAATWRLTLAGWVGSGSTARRRAYRSSSRSRKRPCPPAPRATTSVRAPPLPPPRAPPACLPAQNRNTSTHQTHQPDGSLWAQTRRHRRSGARRCWRATSCASRPPAPDPGAGGAPELK
jgi:hypothetical protein